MPDSAPDKYVNSDIPPTEVTSKSNVIVNLVNIADIIDSRHVDLVSSCVVLIGVEPFALNNLTVEGLNRDVKISKGHDGNVFINNMKAEFKPLGNGIKVLIIQSDETESPQP